MPTGQKRTYVETKCRDCGASKMRRHDSLKYWNGRCLSCSGAYTASLPHVREIHRQSGLNYIERYGRIPAPKHENRRRGLNHHRWGLFGAKNPLWIEDRSKLKVSEDRRNGSMEFWREAVKERDDFKCMMRGPDCDGQLEVHHIFSWRDHKQLRFEVNNGITLCHFHHPKKRKDERRLLLPFMDLVKGQLNNGSAWVGD